MKFFACVMSLVGPAVLCASLGWASPVTVAEAPEEMVRSEEVPASCTSAPGADATILSLDSLKPVAFDCGDTDAVSGAFLQLFDYGVIDWETGELIATGTGTPPEYIPNPDRAWNIARRAATISARRNMLNLLRHIPVRSDATVENFLGSSESTQNLMRGCLQNSSIRGAVLLPDGSAEVTVRMNLRGRLSDIFWAHESDFGIQMPQHKATSSTDECGITGLIIDARGIDLKPAMSLCCRDEDGNLLYGPPTVGKDLAIQRGLVSYVRCLDSGCVDERVGGRPLYVRALRPAGKLGTDVIIATDNANEIREQLGDGMCLAQCRVLVLLD